MQPPAAQTPVSNGVAAHFAALSRERDAALHGRRSTADLSQGLYAVNTSPLLSAALPSNTYQLGGATNTPAIQTARTITIGSFSKSRSASPQQPSDFAGAMRVEHDSMPVMPGRTATDMYNTASAPPNVITRDTIHRGVVQEVQSVPLAPRVKVSDDSPRRVFDPRGGSKERGKSPGPRNPSSEGFANIIYVTPAQADAIRRSDSRRANSKAGSQPGSELGPARRSVSQRKSASAARIASQMVAEDVPEDPRDEALSVLPKMEPVKQFAPDLGAILVEVVYMLSVSRKMPEPPEIPPHVMAAFCRVVAQGSYFIRYNATGASPHERYFALRVAQTESFQREPLFLWSVHDRSWSAQGRFHLGHLVGITTGDTSYPGFRKYLVQGGRAIEGPMHDSRRAVHSTQYIMVLHFLTPEMHSMGLLSCNEDVFQAWNIVLSFLVDINRGEVNMSPTDPVGSFPAPAGSAEMSNPSAANLGGANSGAGPSAQLALESPQQPTVLTADFGPLHQSQQF